MTVPLIPPSQASSSEGPLLLAASDRSDLPRVTELHRHERGQLLGATQGLLSVDAGGSRWMVPATYAVWIPPGIMHGLRSHGPFEGWSVYFQATACGGLPLTPRIVAMSGLLHEAVRRALSWPDSDVSDVARLNLSQVIIDEIRSLPAAALCLPMPQDRRLLRIAEALAAQPSDARKMSQWAAWAGIAPRTLTRRFQRETGFSFSAWRQRVRLLHALELLAAGRPVTTIALDLGYDNASAFIAMFRKVFGVTPGRYEVKEFFGGAA